jgi:hypothetical protein
MSSKPLWLKVVLRAERAIGEPVEWAVRTDTYFDVVTKVTRVTAKAKGTAEGASRRALHLLNLPAGSDVRRLREQLSRVERRLSALSDDVAELDGAPPAPAPKSRNR